MLKKKKKKHVWSLAWMKGRGPEYHAKEQSRGRNRSAKMEEVVSPSIDFEMIWCLLRRESPLPLPVPYFIPLFT